ncbi:type II secretion system protein [Tindallia californiensis]|nr:hypothetical protein [Tindallia californiensis]
MLLMIMSRSKRLNSKGLTLIEVILSFAMMTLLVATMVTGSTFITKHNKAQMRQLRYEQNIRYAVIAIDKRFQQSNRQELYYQSDQQLFTSNVYDNVKDEWRFVYFQFDGAFTDRKNTWLYFHKDSNSLRVNLNGEHNVLASGIDRIEIEEIENNRLVCLRVFCSASDYSASIDIRISPLWRKYDKI